MKACKSACALAAVFASAFAFGQTASQSGGGVSMPAITAPSMPTVSVPTIGGGFYTPTAPNRSAVNKQAATAATTTTTQEQTATTQSASEATQRAVAAQSAQALRLTASDLSSMDSLGLLSSGVLNRGNLSSLAATSLGSTASLTGSTDSLLLQQILTQLTELKEQVAKQNTPAPDAQATTHAVSAVTETYTQETKTGHKILRFVVNGYDVLSTCRDIYFSAQEADGSFLLTGDRKYLSSGANRSETFHLLFRAKGSKEGITHYAVTSAVTQDYTNEYSFLYQLSEREQLTAEQTGNFISLRVNEPNWKCDLLLSLDD